MLDGREETIEGVQILYYIIYLHFRPLQIRRQQFLQDLLSGPAAGNEVEAFPRWLLVRSNLSQLNQANLDQTFGMNIAMNRMTKSGRMPFGTV